MSALRFLHTADWQIGRQYARFEPLDAAALHEARFSVVERIASHACAGGFDAVLVAGDIFDMQTVSERSLRRLFNALDGFDGPWILLPGNHDAALGQSVWSRAQELRLIAPRVFIAMQPQPMVFEAQAMTILPAPLTQRQVAHDLTVWFDQADSPPDYYRIGLAHGSVQGILGEHADSPNPLAPDRARRARLDYLALGDWHGMRRIDERTWYSGTPEPDRFRGNEPGHVLEVELAAPGALPVVTPVHLGQYEWLSWQHSLTVASDLDHLLQRVHELDARHVLELSVQGSLTLAQQAQLTEGLAQARARLRALLLDGSALRVQVADADISQLRADGYVAEVIHRLMALQAGDSAQAPIARDALMILADLLQKAEP